MGNDGGSIAKRDDLVKTRAKAEVADKRKQILAAWFTCALSTLPLSIPVVACPHGRMYNKDAIIEYLISPAAFGAEGAALAGHIRSLKDVKELKLTPNPSYKGDQTTDAAEDGNLGRALWVCPITMREMNGSVRFVFIRGCGCVLSEAALKQLGAAEQATATETSGCPVCGRPWADGERLEAVVLNPVGEEAERVKAAWAQKRAAEKEEKRLKKAEKKRKNGETEESEAKKVRVDKVRAVDVSITVRPSVKAAVQTSAAMVVASAQAAVKASQSANVASLYAKPGDKQQQSWMTMGTFTRYAG